VIRWIKNFTIIASLLLVSCTTPGLPAAESSEVNLDIIHTQQSVEVKSVLGEVLEVFDAPNLTLSEQRARRAAVKVRSLLQGGHGSGTYMVAYGRRVVVTAAHVVRSESVMAIDGRDGETVVGKVVFVDNDVDLAFLVVPEMESRTAIRYRPQHRYDDRLVGTTLTYTGFPSHHDLLTIRGYVAAIEKEHIVTNMFGWFGSSGSGVFDRHGRYVGCVSGIDVGTIGFGMRIPLESIVWVAPASKIDHDMLEIRIATSAVADTINAFPGARAPRRGGLRD
jgi:S1-C subfamily serine protease